MSSAGRGRGRGSTLPAWMTHGERAPGDPGSRDRDPRDAFDRDRDRDSRDRRGEREQGAFGRGLGFVPERVERWDRDRGMGRGDVNFVRGETLLDRDHDRRDVREGEMAPAGGRGRGRGRGGNINRPAWMDHESGPAGREFEDKKEEKQNDTMELLLAQARQVQQEQIQKQRRQLEKEEERAEKRSGNDRKEAEKKQREQEELLKQQKLEEARIKAEQEQKALELQREQEEQRQLLALMGEEDKMEEDDAINDKKRLNDEERDLFEFETEEEREERLARKRREERRKKLKVLESNDSVGQVVDVPRNSAGVIASEMENAIPSTGANQSSRLQDHHAANEQPDRVLEKNVATADKSDDDSFDIFSAENPTPIPTQSKNASTRNTNVVRSSIAQECDDAEGYYKASIGEIITLPKQHRTDKIYNEVESGDDRFARFRVLGIIGKGVFSTVVKVVEDTNISNNSNDDNNIAGREMAMKIIRNNEVMAKAAAKEMRILRMLCRPREKNKRKEEGKSDTNGGEEEDLDEKERRERENHNIVRLLEVDSTMAWGDASLAIPPPEFRSHCVFLFEFLPYNLREVLSKFGKNVGITLTAVRSYARQLLSALGHLEKHRIVHGELFPRLEQLLLPL
eukprot:CCRYP_000178-RA/>CCRYP_000178-RA protein AED:0.01 eAED:0.01 QI:30/1/1/1/1/1/3/875/626